MELGVRLAVAASAATALVAALSAPAGAVVPTTWCGNGVPPVGANRKPELNAGPNLHVIYARATDQTDRFSSFADPIVTDVATSDAWWKREDSTRAPRWDEFGFPGCSGVAALDLSSVPLPRASSAYSEPSAAFGAITDDIAAQPFAFTGSYVTYLVYYDGPESDANLCGIGGTHNGQRVAIMFMRSCGLTVGNGRGLAHTATHELIHALGETGGGMPNECLPPNDGHVCDSARDIMYPFTDDSPIEDWFLDVGRNDYYGHTGSQINIRNSVFLAHLDTPTAPLTTNIVGTGSASVDSDVPGVSCTNTCGSNWDNGSMFQLTETPGTKTRFVGWSGACTGTSATCDLTMDAAKSVTATFAFQVPLTIQINAQTGSGNVISAPERLLCPTTCSADFDQNSQVTLQARPGTGSRLEAWGGACSGRGDCVVTMAGAQTVTATFGLSARLLHASVKGRGRVTSSPVGISCPGACRATFEVDHSVQLTARAAKGYRFAGWSGACSGRGACSVTMSADESVVATFRRK